MLKRRLAKRLNRLVEQSPAVALLGSRQVGKTTLALELSEQRPSVYLDLERPRDLARLGDIEAFHELNRDKLIILDEIQRAPELFAPLRSIIDAERRSGRKAGQFLLLGSASIELMKQSSESLAGRIAYLELGPFDLLEVEASALQTQSKDRQAQLWLRGGFPESYLAATDAASLDWRQAFIRTYLERDIPLLGPRIPAETLRRFWTMLAHLQGSQLNAAQLARNLGVTGVTIARYLDLMVDLLLVRRLQPWTRNVGKRLVRAPKVYVRDSGLVHALLDIETANDLLGHPVVGGSWEGFVLENLSAVAPERAQYSYYRTSAGAEIDLVIEPRPGEIWAVEVKRSSAPVVSKGFHLACDDIGATHRYVVYPGSDMFPMAHGVTALPLAQAMAMLAGEVP